MAQTIVDYSLGLRQQELLRIEAPALAQPLVKAVLVEALRAGANVLTRAALDELDETFLRLASAEQLDYVSEIEFREIEAINARLVIGGSWNARALAGIDPQRQARRARARAPLLCRLLERKARGELRSCITLFPTQAQAQLAEMALAEYEEFVFQGCFADKADPIAEWQALSRRQAGLVERLKRVRQLRIEAADTELELSVAGRNWVNSDGKANFPSGEVFSSPVEDSVNGVIRFEFPAIHAGREVCDLRLEFAQGRVVRATATQGQDFLDAMLASDEGARRLGEVAFGTNPGIQRFTRNILFDEKIGGTMHFALGSAYPECGGLNRSAIHWDLIKDLRPGGRVRADGDLLYENGRFAADE
jgi:aminopeptidase